MTKMINVESTMPMAVLKKPSGRLLTCPIRGPLNVSSLAKDGLTLTEEARRIEMLRFFVKRKYPKANIAVETTVIKALGSDGRNKLRCDAIIYSVPSVDIAHLTLQEKLKYAIVIAEVKRDSSKKENGISQQLEPALRQLPAMSALGVYWDDSNRLLLIKKSLKQGTDFIAHIEQDSIANLPEYGGVYQAKAITFSKLVPPDNLVSVLTSVANVMRSHGVNDEQLRYKETVKLILARYCDERTAAQRGTGELALQVKPGKDPEFKKRIENCYKVSAKRYSNAKTLFAPIPGSELENKALKDVIALIQGIHFSAASTEMMQQLFMSFVPAVFKKSLDQYFTPISLINCIVDMVQIGPNDKIADPAMGTADFLTAALNRRLDAGDADIDKRIFGADVDQKAYDLAVINMILHKDGQTGLMRLDSIGDYLLWNDEIDVALCNPPFGEKSVERRPEVLKHYDLGHQWKFDSGKWKKTTAILASQQLGILFLERCFKLLSADGGRLSIILPEGYLCTASYGYVRQWIVENLRVISLIELPRRIFLKSDADLRSTVLVGQKMPQAELKKLIKADYPIHAELVRKVGYKLGSGFPITPICNKESGAEIRDDENRLIPDSDFVGVSARNSEFNKNFKIQENTSKQVVACKQLWIGARISDVLKSSQLDLKPRRLTPKALANLRTIESDAPLLLSDIATLVTEKIDIGTGDLSSQSWRLVEGQDIRAIEGIVLAQEPMRGWRIAKRKGGSVYSLKHGDIVIGLVRPERRNVGLLLSKSMDLVGSPDGIAVVRLKPEYEKKYSGEWLLAKLRSEEVRLQFWTESGGTSYGKLTDEHILNVKLSKSNPEGMTDAKVASWAKHQTAALELWSEIGSAADRKPILNSPIFGLEWPSEEQADESDESDDE